MRRRSPSLTAAGDAASYHWDFGDGTTADGAVVAARLRAKRQVPGRHDRDRLRQPDDRGAAVRLGARCVAVRQERCSTGAARCSAGESSRRARRRGSSSDRVARSRPDASHGWPLRGARARAFDQAVSRRRSRTPLSPEASMLIRPAIRAALQGSLGGRPSCSSRALDRRPSGSCASRSREGRRLLDWVFAGRSCPLSTRRTPVRRSAVDGRCARVRARTETVQALVRVPSLGPGASGPSVRLLQQRLRELRFALPRVNGYYGIRTTEAVLAFQKLYWLPRTGAVSPALWARLPSSDSAPSLLGGTHIEVDKSRQILFDVVGGDAPHHPRLRGATGNTPSARGTSTARCRAGTGCSGTRCTSSRRSPCTAIPRFPRTGRLGGCGSRWSRAHAVRRAHAYGRRSHIY